MDAGTKAIPHAPLETRDIEAASFSARALYLAELPSLLTTNRGDWVAYTATERVALGRSHQYVYGVCCERGLQSGEFLLTCIEPDVRTEIDI